MRSQPPGQVLTPRAEPVGRCTAHRSGFAVTYHTHMPSNRTGLGVKCGPADSRPKTFGQVPHRTPPHPPPHSDRSPRAGVLSEGPARSSHARTRSGAELDTGP